MERFFDAAWLLQQVFFYYRLFFAFAEYCMLCKRKKYTLSFPVRLFVSVSIFAQGCFCNIG